MIWTVTSNRRLTFIQGLKSKEWQDPQYCSYPEVTHRPSVLLVKGFVVSTSNNPRREIEHVRFRLYLLSQGGLTREPHYTLNIFKHDCLVWSMSFNTIQGYQVSSQSGSEWSQMGQIQDFFRLDFTSFWLAEIQIYIASLLFSNKMHYLTIWHFKI